ncbi:MAG TPA: ATP-binding protein [Rhodothermales bacterium]|nr:ATP-binding protein [Rhodothermales bacterium]
MGEQAALERAGTDEPYRDERRRGPLRSGLSGWGTAHGYLLAAGLTMLSFLLKLVLETYTGPGSPFLFFPLAVLLSAWFGGVGPGLLATVASTAVTAYFFFEPERTTILDAESRVQVFMFLVESLVFCWLAFVLHRDDAARRRAHQERAELLAKEQAARQAAETAEHRASFLARAGTELASSLDYERTLRAVVHLIVPELADWCTVSLTDADGAIKQIAAAHRDSDRARWVETYQQQYGTDKDAAFGTPKVIRTGETEFYPHLTDERLESGIQDKAQLEAARRIGLRSLIIVPLRAHGAIHGAMSFVRAETDVPFTEADVHFAEELAHRAALAVDNARLYREARLAERAAEELARLKSAFLANMSHEIRTPLQGVIGFASLLARQVTGKQQDYAERIMTGGRRLMDTLNAVLTLARLEAQQTDFVYEALDVDHETREIVASFQRRAEERGLYLVYDIAPGAEGSRARLDPGAFSSILNNLIGNALKFTREGGVTVAVARASGGPTESGQDDQVRISISDTGMGIGAEFLPRLFDAFQQESTGYSRSHEGSGLGLSITKRLVDAMGGQIAVNSEKERGSTFTVTLPCCDTPVREEAPTGGQPFVADRRARVLLVEDSADTRDFLVLLLREACDVIQTDSATEAVSLARCAADDEENPFDLIFLDINLGSGLTGVDVLHSLRRQTAYEHAPILALTAFSLPGDREQFLAAGFTDYIGKPFTADELLERTSQLLAR